MNISCSSWLTRCSFMYVNFSLLSSGFPILMCYHLEIAERWLKESISFQYGAGVCHNEVCLHNFDLQDLVRFQWMTMKFVYITSSSRILFAFNEWQVVLQSRREHNWWHVAACQLELGGRSALKTVLYIYDEHIWGSQRVIKNPQVFHLDTS